ncbi:hypothetical protein QA596_02625 [Balneolales bacterium ANBcel1]|nr:hypothetical protein [Balneolales bacterium ANBcel1]
MIPLPKALFFTSAALLLFASVSAGQYAEHALFEAERQDTLNVLHEDAEVDPANDGEFGNTAASGNDATPEPPDGGDTLTAAEADDAHGPEAPNPSADTIHETALRAASPLQRTGRNAVFAEVLGSAINLYAIYYERALRENLHARIGASWIGYSDQVRYEDRGEDLFFDLYTIPAGLSLTLFEGINQLELGVGLTFFSMKFEGGPFDLGYNDVELGNRYKGVAVTTVIGYRVSVHNYLFRIGLSPHYMITINSELSGFFDELKDRGALDLHDYLDFKGFRMIPGLSFGRTF